MYTGNKPYIVFPAVDSMRPLWWGATYIFASQESWTANNSPSLKTGIAEINMWVPPITANYQEWMGGPTWVYESREFRDGLFEWMPGEIDAFESTKGAVSSKWEDYVAHFVAGDVYVFQKVYSVYNADSIADSIEFVELKKAEIQSRGICKIETCFLIKGFKGELCAPSLLKGGIFMKKILALFIIVLPVALAGINVELDLGHLEFLRDEFDIEGSVEAGYWIYADRQPDGSYRHAQAPGEGVTCVDDVARAAILYLRLFEKSADESHYLKAREALDFLLAMQDVDGDFFNFIFADGKINRNGPTSRKGGNWWAARGLWALSTGAWVLSQRDPSYSMELARASHKAFRVLLNYERDGLIQGYTDISSVALLGAVELYRISNDLEVLNFIKRCSGSLRSKLITDKDSIFRGLVDENAPQENVPNWHGWGSRQLEALAMTALALEDDELLGLAADAFKDGAMLLLSTGPVYSLSGFVQLFPQIAYAAEAAISTGYTLFSITNDREIATITALLGSWFIGLNSLGQSMIGPNGEGYDGMEFSHINRNAGAESTISMLLSLERLSRLPDEYEKYFSGTIELLTPAKVIEAEAMRTGLSEVDTFQGTGISGNAALKVSGVFSLRESVALPPVPYSAFAGVGNVQTGPVSITLRLGES
jgi:hypothetical protein